MAARKKTETPVSVTQETNPTEKESVYTIGDRVCLRGGAVDINGDGISAMYAGNSFPLSIGNIQDSRYSLYYGKYLICEVESTQILKQIVGRIEVT